MKMSQLLLKVIYEYSSVNEFIIDFCIEIGMGMLVSDF